MIHPSKHKNVRLLQVHILFLNMIFILPVLVPYYHDVIGLSFREFMIVEAFFTAVIFVMEVPTGWLADRWTRKHTLMLGTASNIIGFFMLWQAGSLIDAIIAEAFIGTGISLISGTNTALLYDSLLDTGQEDQFSREEGFRHGLGLYVVGGSALIGGFLYQINPELPMILTFVTSILALSITFFLHEPDRHKAIDHTNPLVDMAKTMRYALRGHAEIAAIIMLSAILFATTKIFLWVQQPYYMLLNLPEIWFGIFIAAGSFLGGAAGQFSHKLDGKYSNMAFLTGMMVILAAAGMISALWPGYHGVALLMVGTLIWGAGSPRVQDAINSRVGSSRRATILSTARFMVQLVAIPLLLLSGWTAEQFGIADSLLIQSIILLALGGAAATLFYARERRQQRAPL